MSSHAMKIMGAAAASPAEERRLTERFTAHWREATTAGLPNWRQFRAIDLGADWNAVFAVDLRQSLGFPFFIYLGPSLAHLADVYLSGDEEWTLSLLDRATDELELTAAAGKPISREATLTLFDGHRVMFRCVTAPLAENGVDITHVCGVACGRLTD